MEGNSLARQIVAANTMDDHGQRLAGLFDTHHDRLYRLARRMVLQSDYALDLVQETFLRAARFPDRIPTASAKEEEAWLVRVLVNIRRDQWRKQTVRSERNPIVESRSDRQDPEASFITRTTVWRAMDK